MSKFKTTLWSRVILNQLRYISGSGSHFYPARSVVKTSCPAVTRHFSASSAESDRAVQEVLFEVERDRQREREERKRKGLDTADIDAEDEEDFMGVGPLIEKLEKEKLKGDARLNLYEERSESDSDEDDERYSPESVQKRFDDFEKKFKRHEELLKSFTEAGR